MTVPPVTAHADEEDRLVGIVTRRKSETAIAVSMTRQVDGMVGVVDHLTYHLDDARIREDQALHGAADGRLRGL